MGVNDSPWLLKNPDRVRLLGPVCVAYGHPDLVKTHKYVTDFGLVEAFRGQPDGVETVYYRGYGVSPVAYIASKTQQPEFLGVFFEAATIDDLKKATKIPGAGGIEDFVAGGQVVHIKDPTGMFFHVVFGLEKRQFTPPPKGDEPYNFPSPSDADLKSKPRRGRFHRMERGIVPVHKLGHCGVVPADIDASCDFYSTHFNFKPSDIMLGPGGAVMIIFYHVDLGQEYSEHHSFFLAAPHGPLQPGKAHHAAFEVESIDKQFIGHDYLDSQGYDPFWGVGRHIEGSQVFDYWFDLDGFLVEHYADGDLVNEDNEIGWVGGREGKDGSNWGPGLPNPKPPKATASVS